MPELDEFGIPKKTTTPVDEFGIPVKKKDGGLNGTTTPAPSSQSVSPSPSVSSPKQVTYNDIENILAQTREAEKSFYNATQAPRRVGDKFDVASGVEAQYQSGVDEQKKQSKVILDQRTAEKNRILKDNARAISRPVDRIFEEGKYKDFFTEDGAFDYEKATDHFNEYVKKYGGGTFLRETWVADLKKRGQFEMDRPQYEGLLNGELKKAGIDMNKYGKQTFDNLAAKQYTQLSTVKSESEKEANAAFRVVQGTADESVKAFNNFVTNIDEQVKLGQISSEEGRKMYETKKAELDATLQSLNTKYKNDVMGINARVNKRYGRIENELKAISNQVTNQKVWESIPEKDRAVIMKAQDNAFKKLQEQKNAARKGRDYAGQMTGGPANLLTQSLVSGFNRGLANIGDHLIINKFDNKFSQWMRSMYTTADQTAPAQYEFNKDEWLKRATVSTGSSIGASAPILVPTFIASVATGGGAAGTIAAGLISMEGEGVMQSGDTFRNNIERDGDVVKAAKNADQAQAENRKNLPFYFISGMGEQMLIKAKGLKSMLGGFGLELSEEIPVEYRQQYITAKQDGYKGDLVQFVKDNPEIALETAMSTAGQSGSFAVAGKAIGMLSSKVPEANTQFLTDMIQAKGVDFGKQVLQKYFEQGLINEQELKAQTEQLTKLNGDISKLKELNVDGNAAKVFTVLSIQSDQLKRRIEAEKNDAAKIILQKQLADVTGEMKGLVDNTTPYVVFNLPGGMNSTRVMTERQFNSLSKEDADKLVQAADGFEVVGNDEFKANLETKKAELGIPAGVTDGAYTTAAPEVSNIDSSKRETIKNKFDFITDNDFTEESFTPEEDAAFRENLPESGIASEEELNTLLERGEYAMLTGQNPDAVPMSREANAKLNEKAKAWLAERGLKPVEIFGKYGNSERSFLVPGMTKEQAVEFAQEFQQDSVAHSSGLVYKDGSYNPRTEGVNLEDRFDNGGDFFSTINVGGKKVDFSINYDFDKKITPDSTIADEILRDVLGQSQDTQSAIDNVQKALESTGVKVEVINDETVFEQKTGGQRGVDGLFVAEDGTILLNDKRLKESGEAGRIIFHEGAHPVMNIIRNTNRPLYDQVVAGLKEAAANNKEIAASLEWSKDTSDVEDVQNDEAIVETIAKIADGTLDPNTIETGLRQKLIDLINLIAKALGLGQIAGDTDVAAFKKLASEVANALAGGEDIAGIVGRDNLNEYQNNIQIGTEVGEPTQLRKGNVNGESVKVKDNHALSFVKQEDIFDLPALVKEIQDKGQKVWFWVADQLGRGNYYDKVVDGEHYLDAGPSFALDPENRSKNVIWATGKGEKWINDKIANSDYIFIISGSPSKSKLFNKRVAELTVNRIKSVIGEENAWDKFKNEVLSVSKISKINNIMNEFTSFEELLNSPKRKDLLIEFDNQKEKKGTPLKALLEKYNAFVDYDELRDGFYKDNDFKQNDVMLVLKPTGFGGQSKHSTYENDVLGEVIGVPNKKINAFDLMPDDFKIKYEKELSRTEQSQAVAPYGVGIRNVQARKSSNLVQDAKLDKKMTVDGNGNYVFYHYSAKKFSKVDPNKFGSNTSATGRDERPGMGMSMFYTKPDMREPGVSGDNGYIVRVPMDKVYPFNKDPLNFYDEAKARFEKQFPGQAFEPNKQLSFITQVANENGFPMTVAKWNIKGRNGLRAQTTQALKVEPLTEEAQNYKAQARKSALEQTTDFKLAAFVMRKKAEGATPEQIATGIKSAIPSMTAQDIAEVAENPEVYINKKFAYLSEDLRANLIGRAKVQNIYKATPKNAGAFTGFEVEMDLVREALKNNRKEQFKEAVKDFGKKWLTATKGLPDWVLGLKDRATGGKNFEVDRAARIIAKLKATAKKISFSDWDAFSKAMVAMGNQPVREMSNGTDIAMYDPYRAAAAGPALQDNELPATVPDEVKALPAELVPFVYQMRGTIDRLTQDLVGSGYVSPEQAAVLESNLGQYVNRAYRLFNEKGYKPTPEAFENAVKFIADQKFGALLNQYYGINAPASTSTGSTAMAQFGGNLGGVANIPWDAIKKQALDEARKEVNAIVSRSKNPYFSAKTESRNTGILQERKDIPEAIRKVMGEYTDPGTVFIMTVGKQAALKASSEYLTQLREKGLGTIFFEENDPNRPVTHSVKIASDTGETKAPLNGLYTTPQIAEELDSMEPTYNSLVQLWMKTVGAVRWGKTVGSVVTQFKNFESNIGFAVMNGLLFSGNNAQAVKSSGNYVKGQYTKGEVDALTEKVMKLGLVGQSVGARELASMLSSGDIHDIAVDMALNPKSKFNKVKDAVGMPFEQANKLYRLGDDFWKVYAYINEREQLGKALFGDSYDKLTPEQQKDVDVEASERVKNTWPTYDRIFEAAKYISKRAPIFGNFVSFQAESLRVLGNTFLIASQDMKSDNKDIQALGLRRFLGVAMYIGLRAAILSAVSHAAGIAGSGILAQFGGDEEEKRKKKGLNKAMPTFMRVGDIAVVHNKKEPWKYTVYNLSSIDPYGLIPNSLNAITEGREGVLGNTMQPGVIAGLVEMFSSFTEPEMTFAAMYSVLNNANRKTGGQIVLENDSNGEAAAKIGKYLFDQLKPSTIDMIERLHERDNKSAELSAMAGARPYDVDLHKSFRYAVSSMIKELASVNTKFGSVNLSEKSTEADKLKAERDAEEYKAKLINNMHQLYKDFVLLGAQPDVLNEIIDNTSAIRSTGFDKQTKKAIKSGDFDQTKLYKQRK